MTWYQIFFSKEQEVVMTAEASKPIVVPREQILEILNRPDNFQNQVLIHSPERVSQIRDIVFPDYSNTHNYNKHVDLKPDIISKIVEYVCKSISNSKLVRPWVREAGTVQSWQEQRLEVYTMYSFLAVLAKTYSFSQKDIKNVIKLYSGPDAYDVRPASLPNILFVQNSISDDYFKELVSRKRIHYSILNALAKNKNMTTDRAELLIQTGKVGVIKTLLRNANFKDHTLINQLVLHDNLWVRNLAVKKGNIPPEILAKLILMNKTYSESSQKAYQQIADSGLNRTGFTTLMLDENKRKKLEGKVAKTVAKKILDKDDAGVELF